MKKSKTKINPNDFYHDIKSGITDEDLLIKYGIPNYNVLNKLLEKLEETSILEGSIDLIDCPKCNYRRTYKDDEFFSKKHCPSCKINYHQYKNLSENLSDNENIENISWINESYKKIKNKYNKFIYLLKLYSSDYEYLTLNKYILVLVFLCFFGMYFLRDTPEDIVSYLIKSEARFYDPDSIVIENIRYSPKESIYCGSVNAKNRMGGYGGWSEFIVSKNDGLKIIKGTGLDKLKLHELIELRISITKYEECMLNERNFFDVYF